MCRERHEPAEAAKREVQPLKVGEAHVTEEEERRAEEEVEKYEGRGGDPPRELKKGREECD